MFTQTGSQALSLFLAFLIGVTTVSFSVNLHYHHGKLHTFSFLDTAKYCHKLETEKHQCLLSQKCNKDKSTCGRSKSISVLGLTYKKVRDEYDTLTKNVRRPFQQKILIQSIKRVGCLSSVLDSLTFSFKPEKFMVLFQCFLN